MIRCQACGTQNLDSSQYCDECGDSLQKYQAPETPDEPMDQMADVDVPNADREVPVFQSASVTTIGVPPVFEEQVEEENRSDGSANEQVEDTSDENETALRKRDPILPAEMPKGVHAKLIIERGQAIGTEFPLSSEESNIGRWDADNGVFPDVDLDAHDSEAKVSRKHARVLIRDGQYLIEDLGSTNGTFINRGRRLIPGSPHVLNDGDEIIVGKTFLRFQLVQ